MEANRIQKIYKELYGSQPRLFKSPGRINLIGEHTDYNDGFVMPAGIDKNVFFAVGEDPSGKFSLHAADINDSYVFTDFRRPEKTWTWFHLGVFEQLAKAGFIIPGMRIVFGGDVPLGAGLSSSAAIECGLLFAVNELYGLGLDKAQIVRMAQKAENEYVGVQCGIMDQFASVFAAKESVIRLDCRSLAHEYFPFPAKKYSLVLCDSTIKHSLASSEYNTRRIECEQGVSILQKFDPQIHSLRDASPQLVNEHRNALGEIIFMRCKYVTEEIERVQRAGELLLKNDLDTFGRKMLETHQGLSKEYEVSCPELDFLVTCAQEQPGLLGSRMMGGGFGGCTLNLLKRENTADFEANMKAEYRSALGLELPTYLVHISDGSSEIL